MRRGEIVGLKWADLDRSAAVPSDEPCRPRRPARRVRCQDPLQSRCIDLDAATVHRARPVAPPPSSRRLPERPRRLEFCNPPAATSTLSRSASSSTGSCTVPTSRGSASTTCATPTLAARRRRGADQGRDRTSRARPPGVHDAHLPAPPARHERRRRRTVRQGSSPPPAGRRLPAQLDEPPGRSRRAEPVESPGRTLTTTKAQVADLGLHMVAGAGFEPATFGL